MQLEMYITGIMIDRTDLNYEGFVTVNEVQEYQERIANDLYFKHIRKIKLANDDPVFYVNHVLSRMPQLYDASWKEIIQQCGSCKAKKIVNTLCQQLESEEEYKSQLELPAA